MRLFTKIFLFGMLVFGVAFSVSGYFLLHYSLESSMAREVDFALKQHQYDKFTVQSALLTELDVSVVVSVEGEFFSEEGQIYTIWGTLPEGQFITEGQAAGEDQRLTEEQGDSEKYSYQWESVPSENQFFSYDGITWGEKAENLFRVLAEEISVPVAFFAEDKTPIYSEIEGVDEAFLESLSEESHLYQFRNVPGGGAVLVGSILYQEDMDAADQGAYAGEEDSGKSGECIYFVTQWDIGKTIMRQETMQQHFMRCYLAAMAVGMILLGLLSALLTRPLKRMSKAARRMAEGDYGERFAPLGRDEIGQLAESFNLMAGAVEEKIGELSKAAREKEDFVANFAHELKTPLTSIIGYADTIYQKELSREEIRKASWHIWNEGMRLEALSLKLMDLTVLGRQEFILEEMPADELLWDVSEGFAQLFREKQIVFELEADPAYIRVDYDLLKTLLINLVDNAVKAGGTRIEMSGRREGAKYRICVRDNGCGMEEEELSRITEAFYMVDKARSRKQHGAGLGLSLAERIAGVHGGELIFKSRKGAGTEVALELPCKPLGEDSSA